MAPPPSLKLSAPTVEALFSAPLETRHYLLSGPNIPIYGCKKIKALSAYPRKLLIAVSSFTQDAIAPFAPSTRRWDRFPKRFDYPVMNAQALGIVLADLKNAIAKDERLDVSVPEDLSLAVETYHIALRLDLHAYTPTLFTHLEQEILARQPDYDELTLIEKLIPPSDPLFKHLIHVLTDMKIEGQLTHLDHWGTWLKKHPVLQEMFEGSLKRAIEEGVQVKWLGGKGECVRYGKYYGMEKEGGEPPGEDKDKHAGVEVKVEVKVEEKAGFSV